ncbi:MAG: hypothetical protein IME93_06230 [Proteobacteria bacterium]|nr:hypothetical protein [Pseudomonadota bacterium]
MSKQDKDQVDEKPLFERRSGGDRRSDCDDSERRGPLRWDPENKDRRNGGDRRRPGYLTDIPDRSDPEDQ